jgi:1,4-dihydroxy-2-naphthoate octaprenyltransferase
MKIKSWLEAFRLRTLPLSVSGIIMGSFIAKSRGFWDISIFIFALITTILFQIVSNLANDLGDSLKGTDNEFRVGPERSVQKGDISPFQMKIAVVIFSILSLISAGYLILISSNGMKNETIYTYLFLALASVLAAITYTVGKKAYGYYGFGDVFVFAFFGLVSVMGSYTLYTKVFDWNTFFPAITIGFLSTAVLNLNNMRDQVNDKNSNKNTLVVKLGFNRAKMYHVFLIIGALISFLVFFKFELKGLVFSIPFILLLIHLKKVVQVIDPKEFDPELKKVALSTFFLSLFFAVFSIFIL